MADAIWYGCRGPDGAAPYAQRMCRRPLDVQRAACGWLAYHLASGRAEYRDTVVRRPGSGPEMYVYWPDCPAGNPWQMREDGKSMADIARKLGINASTVSLMLARNPSAWWLISERDFWRAMKLTRIATAAAMRRKGIAYPEDTARILSRWAHGNRWRRKLARHSGA